MNYLHVALAQINVTVGALEENAGRILEAAVRARERGAHVVVFPELSLSGYPPEDLLLRNHFVEACEWNLRHLASQLPPDIVTLIGSPTSGREKCHNSAAIFSGGRMVGLYHKMILPNYGVFDEQRVFTAGDKAMVLNVAGVRCGLHICEDSWFTEQAPMVAHRECGLHAILNLSSSPYHRGKLLMREEVLRKMARTVHAMVFYCNLVGGQDELVFDGASKILAADGRLLGRARQFEEDLLMFSVGRHPSESAQPVLPASVAELAVEASEVRPLAFEPASLEPSPPMGEEQEVYAALRLGLRDYVEKNGFQHAVVAVSGGIDSALVTALAVDALGPERVTGVTMPSRYSSEGTRSDAAALAGNLGIPLLSVPIERLLQAYTEELEPLWPGREPDTTEENLQARIRGTIVMALSNKFGWLVLTTGNKSEIATGYCTLYGDMAGGFAVIKDVPKTLVFRLAEWRNRQAPAPVIPASTLSRAPSAELRPDQKDSDTLPPYELLDAILERYVEQDKSAAALIAEGFEEEVVRRVIRLIDHNEYKRRQGAPGIKITPKAFGRDRRLPITNRYRS